MAPVLAISSRTGLGRRLIPFRLSLRTGLGRRLMLFRLSLRTGPGRRQTMFAEICWRNARSFIASFSINGLLFDSNHLGAR
jgi:hypothetical protein